MNQLLMVWLSLSLSGSFVALALFLLRPFVRRLSKTWQYYLWLLVVFRLLVPFSPDKSLVGSLLEQAQPHWSEPYTFIQNAAGTGDSEPSEAFKPSAPQEEVPQIASSPVPASSFVQKHLWGTIWFAAAVLLVIRKIVGYVRFLKTVKKESRAVDGPPIDALEQVRVEMGIKKNISVCINPFVMAPMLIGAKNPTVVLPDETINEAAFPYIFRHELTHFRRMDFLYKWLMEITLCLHWFNPVVYWVRKETNRYCELSCDEAVISRLKDAQRRAYGETLLSSIRINERVQTGIAPLPLSGDAKLIRERLSVMMKYKRTSLSGVFITATLTLLLLCGTVYSGAYSMPAAAVDSLAAPATDARAQTTDARAQTTDARAQTTDAHVQTVVYDSVELRRYEGEDGHPYIHDMKTNHTTRKIVGYQWGMLAFDRDGAPLKIDWWSLDTELDSTYFQLSQNDLIELAAGETDDVYGGWSLNVMGKDLSAGKIAYVLYCDKEITFEDGTVWKNPDFENWRLTYEGQTVDVDVLESYYPYEHKIEF